YLAVNEIRMYRISSDLAPYLTHPDLPQFHTQIEESSAELEAIGARARDMGLRLSFHPSQYILLNAADESIAEKSVRDLQAQATMLDRMGLGPEAVVVTHVGGVYGDKETSLRRFIDRYAALAGPARRRLVVENDDVSYGIADVVRIHQATGIPVVLDTLHHHNCNPTGTPLDEALGMALATWPAGVRAKIHFSSPRTEMRTISRKDADSGKRVETPVPPLWTQHSDYVNPFEFIGVARLLGEREADVMLEAKAKDLALLRLREDLQRFAPELAGRFC
ncbi:MAG TPA: UV DNA damage repair endonuclease UvsE, partial [Ardenticatenaceae bacterium]|nr:UV DNA damage repair endonuclease UvsE [Ardenticatenaceae bacterium]